MRILFSTSANPFNELVKMKIKRRVKEREKEKTTFYNAFFASVNVLFDDVTP